MNSQNIIINTGYEDPEKKDIEIVERKGLGHPDSLSRWYSQCHIRFLWKILFAKFRPYSTSQS